jgi:hypothetical protein
MPYARHILPLLAVTTALRGDPLDHARRAQAMLGEGMWTRVIRIENSSIASAYPATVYALVFEASGILWFYTETDGTQSLSTHVGTAARDKTDYGRLLLSVDPGFTRWSLMEPAAGAQVGGGRIPNGCFIESVALLRLRLEAGQTSLEPRLLSYYVNRPDGVHGHTVLQFRTGEGITLLDPDRPSHPVLIRPKRANDPASCVACIRNDVARARWIPLEDWRQSNGPSVRALRHDPGRERNVAEVPAASVNR